MRYPVMIAALAFLVLGVWSGLGRLGIAPAFVLLMHGPIMVSAFLGTLIGVERAVGLNKNWIFLGPLCCVIGGVLAVNERPEAVFLFIAGSVLLTIAALLMTYLHPGLHTGVMAAGAICWLVGNLLYQANPANPIVALWWAGFPLLTVIGERLQLSALRRPPRAAVIAFVVLVFIYLTVPYPPVWGGAVTLLALWLFRYDISSRTVRLPGLARYSALCVLSATALLAVHGLLVVFDAPRDAVIHSLFLGFMLPMIFGHMPIIFPSIIKRPLPFHPFFYVPLIALHLSLALRLVGGTIHNGSLWQWGGIGNAVAILIFFITTASSVVRGALYPTANPLLGGRSSLLSPPQVDLERKN